ncbi:MAG: thioredoxin fold domain-containing protein [Candidatus Methanoperedens sp.]|nr:thioredoxin fold domain-containing protein [Candidatus Methanoperedens sp.]
MNPTTKLISIIAFGAFIFILAISWENLNAHEDQDFIELGIVSFHTSLDQGIKEAKNTSKPVFLYFRSQTCYWCLEFEEESLSDKRITEILTNNFILVSIDTFKQKNISSNLNVRTTPYIIFFTRNGEEISRIPGYIPKEEFLIKLNEI